ncbi:Zinc-finger homeodomain protein 2 [Capsicum baccatum]|uniref:Zinc-finger homeodomain protein 2 n=1 Tax=Capsicum baccatum TaxID=33114 RepID=A0A2G2W8M7_CAPBA|nr:Zinc-finger homeodomain protein 2 [Capsicum baccatum]
MVIKYGVCLKSHATKFGYFAVDGYREFVKSGDDGTKEAYICANCGCIRGFHRKNNSLLHRYQAIKFRFLHNGVIPQGENVSISRPFMREILSTRTPQVSFPTSLPGLIRDPIHKNALRDLTIPM